MPKFGKRSKKRLEGVDSRLVEVLNKVVKYYDITIIEGKRSQERQNKLVQEGKSKTKKGKHVQGKAVDIAPYPIDFDFHYLGGYVLGVASMLGYNVRWGGDWSDSSLSERSRTTKDNNFDDLVHFEILD